MVQAVYCGVARQYTGSAGKITNWQIGVFASHVSRHGHAFIDRALYLPKEWTHDRRRLKAAHVPNNVVFATKPQIARRMITRAIAAKVPFSFVATDTVYGTGMIEALFRNAGKGYPGRRCKSRAPFLGLASVCQRHRRHECAQPSRDRVATPVVRRRSQRAAFTRLGLRRTGRSRGRNRSRGTDTRLLIRRNIAAGDMLLLRLVSQGHADGQAGGGGGHRWAVEDIFGAAKNEFGLGSPI
ncbi:transposase [Bradyrhizobium sp. DASA03076]|uniref:transposase n=1 Tax=Bradyrhizobium sp. BLXBL-03 TaxID=3395916 RepID=UPI003F707699